MAGLGDQRVREALASLASPAKAPAAGVASALACAAAAALVDLTAGLAANRFVAEGAGSGAETEARLRALALRAGEIRERLLAAADADALAYARVLEASDGASRARALAEASEPPLEIAESAAEVAEAAAEVAGAGTWAFRADAVVAGKLAMTAAVGAAELVGVNLAGRSSDPRAERARAAAERAERAAAAAATPPLN